MGSFFIEPSILQLRESQPGEQYVLTELDIASKYITLSRTPSSPESVTITPEGGLQQIYGRGYIVVGNILTWANLGLDGYMEAGEIIIIKY